MPLGLGGRSVGVCHTDARMIFLRAERPLVTFLHDELRAKLKVKMVLTAEGTDLRHEVDGRST